LKGLKEQVAKSAKFAENLISSIEKPKMSINVLDEVDINWVERPIIDLNNPPLNRRNFLGLFSKQSIHLLSKLVEISSEKPGSGKQPSRERLRFLKSIQMLNENTSGVPCSEIVETLNLVKLSVDECCSACGVCAEVCPTGALEFCVDEDKNYELSFLPAYCADCGVCVDCCERGAVHLENIVHPEQAGTQKNLEDSILIKSGQLERCYRCHVYYSSSTNTGLCPICEQRRANPFGFVIPKKLQMQL
jgi:ferredoxin